MVTLNVIQVYSYPWRKDHNNQQLIVMGRISTCYGLSNNNDNFSSTIFLFLILVISELAFGFGIGTDGNTC